MVIVGGGDGSLSCTVDDVVDRDCVFALLPLGTANSFARTLGIPLDLDGAIATIATGRRRRIDLGMIDGDYFANGAAMGLSPMIGESVPHKLKRYLGRVGYLIWAVWCLVRFQPVPADRRRRQRAARPLWATEVRIANGALPWRRRAGRERRRRQRRDRRPGGDRPRACARLIWNWFAKYLQAAGPPRHDRGVSRPPAADRHAAAPAHLDRRRGAGADAGDGRGRRAGDRGGGAGLAARTGH